MGKAFWWTRIRTQREMLARGVSEGTNCFLTGMMWDRTGSHGVRCTTRDAGTI